MSQRNEQFVPDYLRNKYGPPGLALGGARTDRPLTSSVQRRYGDKLQQCTSLNQSSGPSLLWARRYCCCCQSLQRSLSQLFLMSLRQMWYRSRRSTWNLIFCRISRAMWTVGSRFTRRAPCLELARALNLASTLLPSIRLRQNSQFTFHPM